MDKRRTDTTNFVGAHGRANPAATNGHTAVHLSRRDCPRQRHDEIGIIVAVAQTMSAEIDNFMPRAAKLGKQLFLQTKPAVIGGNDHSHYSFSFRYSSLQKSRIEDR